MCHPTLPAAHEPGSAGNYPTALARSFGISVPVKETINFPSANSNPGGACGEAVPPPGTEPTHTFVGADISQEGDEPLSTTWSASSPTSPFADEKPSPAQTSTLEQ